MRTSRTDLSRRRAPVGADPGRFRFARGLAVATWALTLLALPVETSRALDANVRRTPVQVPVADKSYRSAKDALRAGMREYNAGDKQGAARALEYAAGQGHALALWKLGRMYADGDGVPLTT